MNEHDGETKYRDLGSIAVDCVEAMTDIGFVHVDTYDREEALRLQAMEESANKPRSDQKV
jgi:hypothetical protein